MTKVAKLPSLESDILPSSEDDVLPIKCEPIEAQVTEIDISDIKIEKPDEKVDASLNMVINKDHVQCLPVEEFIIPHKLNKVYIKIEPKEDECLFEASFHSIVEDEPSEVFLEAKKDLDCVSDTNQPREEFIPSEASSETVCQNSLDQLPASSSKDFLVNNSNDSNGSSTSMKEDDIECDSTNETEETDTSDTNMTSAGSDYLTLDENSQHLPHEDVNFERPSTEQCCTCETCNKTFLDKLDLAFNKILLGGKSHKYQLCDKAFVRRCNFILQHKTYTDHKPHKCDTCGKTFVWKKDLNAHRMIHTAEKSHKCQFCYKVFTRKLDFIVHYKSHTKLKPHKCDIH